MIFQNRSDAGKQLAQKLLSYKAKKNAIVLGLARGGVLVAYEIAKALVLPLNVLVPRKIGAPDNPELALGAVAEDGEVWRNESVIQFLGVSDAAIREATNQARQAAKERLAQYRKIAPLGDLKGKTVLLVDDGIATGASMLVAIQSLRKQGVKTIVAAAPVAAADAWAVIRAASDEAVALLILESFRGISQFYLDFSQVEDERVLRLLQG